MKRILHLEIGSCLSCPYMAIVGKKTTIIACKSRDLTEDPRFNAKIILEQPISHVIADIDIPDWCPLGIEEPQALPSNMKEVDNVLITPASKTVPGTISLDLIVDNERVANHKISIVAEFTQDDIIFGVT